MNFGNLLNWKTSSEEDVQHYDVEKSVDGVDFEIIGKVEANTDDEKAYHFFDTKLGTQKNYYRLKVVEADGTSSYSQTVLVNKQKPNQFGIVAYSSVMDNSQFDLTLDAVIEGQLEYALVSYEGELIYEEFQYLYPGLNEISLSLQDLPEGAYKVKLKLDDEEESLVIHKTSDGQKSNVKDNTYQYSETNSTKYLLDEASISIYPNPVKDVLNLGIGHFTNLEGQIKIFKWGGNEVISRPLMKADKSVQIDLSNHKNGICFLIILTNDGKIIERQFILENRN